MSQRKINDSNLEQSKICSFVKLWNALSYFSYPSKEHFNSFSFSMWHLFFPLWSSCSSTTKLNSFQLCFSFSFAFDLYFLFCFPHSFSVTPASPLKSLFTQKFYKFLWLITHIVFSVLTVQWSLHPRFWSSCYQFCTQNKKPVFFFYYSCFIPSWIFNVTHSGSLFPMPPTLQKMNTSSKMKTVRKTARG